MGVRSIECTCDEEGDEQYQKRLLSQRLHDTFPGEPRESQIRGVQFHSVHHGDNPPDARPPWCFSGYTSNASRGPGESQADQLKRQDGSVMYARITQVSDWKVTGSALKFDAASQRKRPGVELRRGLGEESGNPRRRVRHRPEILLIPSRTPRT